MIYEIPIKGCKPVDCEYCVLNENSEFTDDMFEELKVMPWYLELIPPSDLLNPDYWIGERCEV